MVDLVRHDFYDFDIPRAMYDDIEQLRAKVASLKKELAERTAGQGRYKRSAAKHFADSCHLADRALTTESRADTLARRVERLEAALQPFAQIADMEERAPVGESVFVNIERCRDARAALTEKLP